MTLENSGGATYIALPKKAKPMLATFSVAAASYRGPVKLRLRIDGLSVKSNSLPKSVTLSGDRKTAVWSISALATGKSSVQLKGTTKVTRSATFGIASEGSDLAIPPRSRTLQRAKGTLTLKSGETGALRGKTLRTLVGTIAASTCDKSGAGTLSLRAEVSFSARSRYQRVVGTPPKVRVDKATADSSVCSFRVSTGLGRRPPSGVRFRFQIRSSNGGKSAKVRFRAP